MHLAEGMLPLHQAVGWTALAAPALVWSLRGEQLVRRGSASPQVIIAGATSLLFAATLLPIPVPVVGATSHVCLTPVLGLVVGVRRIIWPTFFVLLLQAVFFAHGGLTTLGVNMLTLGLLGPVVTVGLWHFFRHIGAGNMLGLGVACGAGGLSVYVADALALAAALSDVSDPVTTFKGILVGFAPVQIPLSVLESVASVGLVRVLTTRKPGLMPDNLKAVRVIPRVVSSALILLLAVGLSGCGYQGIDGTVFGAVAEASGRPPTDSILDLSQGELGLGMSVIILFGLGFVAGRNWERLSVDSPPSEGDDALPR